MEIKDNKKDYIRRLIAGVREQIAKNPDTIKACNDYGDDLLISRWIDASILCDVIEELLLNDNKSN